MRTLSSSNEPGLSPAPLQVSEGLEDAHARFEAELEEVGALPSGRRDRVSLTPRTLTPRTDRRLAQATRRVHGALEHLIDAILASPDRQAALGLTRDELDLHRADPGYPEAVQVARFDGFVSGEGIHLLEFNCDSPGGAARADAIDEAYERQAQRGRWTRLPSPARATRRLPHLAEALQRAYRAWRSARPDAPREPRVVVTDWADVGTRADIDLTVADLSRRGFDVTFADPRELALDGDTLVHEGARVHLVYKRAITRELMDNDDALALLDAYKAGTACVVNPPRSILAGDKRAMAMLFDPDVQARMTPEQRGAVEAHVPTTLPLTDETVRIDGRRVRTREFALEQQEGLVLKPGSGYGGEGVHLGFETDPETWGRLVDEHAGEDTWILQRLVPIPEAVYTRRGREGLVSRRFYENVNPFVFGGTYAGSYTRISPNPTVNVSQGGAVAPTIVTTPP